MKRFVKLLSIFAIFVSLFFTGGTFAANNNTFQESSVTFAHLTDIHIWDTYDRWNNNNPTYPEYLLKAAISQINSNKKIDFTLITGDIIDSPDEYLFSHVLNIFNLLNKPWYYTLGNHDCSWPHAYPKEPLLNIVKKKNKNFIPNGRYYAFHPKKGFTFIGLDGGSYYIDKEQKEFAAKTIKNNPKDVIVVFLHTPILPPFNNLLDHKISNTNEMLEFFSQYTQPMAIIAGHWHGTRITKYGNIIHVASPSLRYSQEYRVINIQNKKDRVIFDFKYKKIYLDKSIYDGADYSRYKGDESDKNAVIVIPK